MQLYIILNYQLALLKIWLCQIFRGASNVKAITNEQECIDYLIYIISQEESTVRMAIQLVRSILNYNLDKLNNELTTRISEIEIIKKQINDMGNYVISFNPIDPIPIMPKYIANDLLNFDITILLTLRGMEK